MTVSIPIFVQSDSDPLPPGCRDAAEQVLHVFIEHSVRHGWPAGAAAMALADAADELILLLSRNMTVKH
jgi:hypothetical protein